MAFITTVPVHDASGDVRTMYEKSQTDAGYVPNYAKIFSHRPLIMAVWVNLIGSIRTNLDARQYELITLAAARALHSSYCMLAHGAILRQQFYPPEQLTAIVEDFTTADLAPVDVAIMSFAEHIVRDAASLTGEDIQHLRQYGLTDTDIFDIAAATAARCFFSKLLDALGVEPDSAYAHLAGELQQQLTMGRRISQTAVEQVPAIAP